MGNEQTNKKQTQIQNSNNIFLDDAEDLGATYNYNSDTITKSIHSKCPFCQRDFNLTSNDNQNLFKNHVFACEKEFKTNKVNKEEQSKRCPKCNQIFYNINLYNNHISICGKNNLTIQIQGLTIEEQNMINQDMKKNNLPLGNPKGTFNEKVEYLRYNINNLKVDWSYGAETISIERDKIIEQSIKQFTKIILYKELKIIFKGEEIQDAGGLIREWLTVLFISFLDEKNNLFQRSDTDEISYICKPNYKINNEENQKYNFIGKVLAKALLENLTINYFFL